MREKIIDAIFDSWTEDGDTDFIRQRKDETAQTIDHLGITKKEKNDILFVTAIDTVWIL